MVNRLMALSTQPERAERVHEALTAHFEAAQQTGVNRQNALRSTFIGACPLQTLWGSDYENEKSKSHTTYIPWGQRGCECWPPAQGLASGIPPALLLNPHKAMSQGANMRRQTLIMSVSQAGDPVNINCPGSYINDAPRNFANNPLLSAVNGNFGGQNCKDRTTMGRFTERAQTSACFLSFKDLCCRTHRVRPDFDPERGGQERGWQRERNVPIHGRSAQRLPPWRNPTRATASHRLEGLL